MEALQKRQADFHHLKENRGFQIIFFKLSLSKRKIKNERYCEQYQNYS